MVRFNSFGLHFYKVLNDLHAYIISMEIGQRKLSGTGFWPSATLESCLGIPGTPIPSETTSRSYIALDHK